MLTATRIAAFLLAALVAWLLARWGVTRGPVMPAVTDIGNADQAANQRLVEHIGWLAVLGYAGIDLIASRGSHWPWRASVALGQVLVLGGLKVTARLGRPPKSERSHYSPAVLVLSVGCAPGGGARKSRNGKHQRG